MFDTIGHIQDEGAGQRRAATTILLTTLAGGLFASAFVLTAWTATEIVLPHHGPDTDYREPYIPIVIEEPLPQVPAPPPPRIARGQEPDPEAPPQPPDDFQDPRLLPPPTTVVNTHPRMGAPDGADDGDPNGADKGVLGGTPHSTGTTFAATHAIPTVHRSDVRLKRRAVPDYPEAARSMNLGEVNCRVAILISETGVAEHVDFQACPSVFHDTVREAIGRMRWYPYRIGGQRSPARFSIQFRFQPG